MINILLTGSNGLVGRTLINYASSHYNFIIFNQKYFNILDINDWFKFSDINYVIHLAAKTSVNSSWKDPQDTLNYNINSTLCALEFCRQSNSKLIFFSSFLYKASNSNIFNENDELHAKNPYALSKLQCENLIKFYFDNFGVVSTIFRPFNIYGFGQSRDFLLGSILEQVINFNRVEILTGIPKRDYIYVYDIVDAVSKLLQTNPINFEIFNLGTGVSHSVFEVLNIISNVSNKKFEVMNANVERKNEIDDTIADFTKFNNYCGWSPKYTLENGIRDIFLRSKKL